MKSDEREYKIWFKPLTLIIPAEREVLFRKLKAQKEKVDLIIENPDLDIKMQMKATEVSVKIAKTMAGILKVAEAHKITEELEELGKLVREELAKKKREDERRITRERLKRIEA